MELAIDTSTRYASIGISSQGESVVELTWRSDRNHSVELVPSIQQLLKRVDLSPRDLEAIFIASGPGGFSALRVGMSAAKAMATSLDVPLVSVGTLDIEAQPYLALGNPVCALVGAGRSRIYLGDFTDESHSTYNVIQHDELASSASPDALFCGEGLPQVADIILAEFGERAVIADAPLPTRRAGVLASLGYRMLQDGRTADSLTLEPLYLRSSQVSAANRTWQNR